jgi:prenyltransferase beta subunit
MAVDRKDVKLPAGAPTQLLTASHADFIAKYGSDPDDYEYAMSEFLRMNGIYWGVTAMDLMGRLGAMDRPGIVQFLRDCQTPAGGFRPVPGQDPHLLNTLSAVQVSSQLLNSATCCSSQLPAVQGQLLAVEVSFCLSWSASCCQGQLPAVLVSFQLS